MSEMDQEKSLELYQEGRDAMDRNDLSMATAKFKEATKLSPHYKTYELLGECLLIKGAFCEAVLYLAAAAGLGNKEFRARWLLAQALLRLNDKELAIEKLDEALASNPDYKAARELRVQILSGNA